MLYIMHTQNFQQIVWCTLYYYHAHANNLLNRDPEHDCLTYFVLHETKFKPKHLNWEIFFNFRRKAFIYYIQRGPPKPIIHLK